MTGEATFSSIGSLLNLGFLQAVLNLEDFPDYGNSTAGTTKSSTTKFSSPGTQYLKYHLLSDALQWPKFWVHLGGPVAFG
eukprot:SAG11_NODE_1333_length_5179_cov_3.502953_6_plen_80_part_00